MKDKTQNAEVLFCLFVFLFNIPANNYGHVDANLIELPGSALLR